MQLPIVFVNMTLCAKGEHWEQATEKRAILVFGAGPSARLPLDTVYTAQILLDTIPAGSGPASSPCVPPCT